jgi:transcription factor IIIB subunit 2
MPGIAPPRRPQRLSGLGGKTAGSFKPIPRPAKRSECGCDAPSFEVIDGAKICLNCGTQVSEQNIVAEVTFGESSSGAATVEGGIVNENSRHAKTLGAAAARRLGASMQSREDSENNGRESLRLFTARLPIPPDVSDKAMGIWKLASNSNFTQGRRADEVAGACLYIACRNKAENTVLLMDIAEVISVNVFSLGDTYKGLLANLFVDFKETTKMIEIEPLILKYASKLEFGEKTRQVAEDAVKIIRRMKRDWIVTGRHPAGLCGACLILAARMNNFRRTVREVVFVVKVADLTISKRLEEFKRTRAAHLKVDEFRDKGVRIREQADPPALLEAEIRKQKLLRKQLKRKAYELSKESSRQSSAAPEPGLFSQAEAAQAAKRQKVSSARSNAIAQTDTQQQQPRLDADGFAIPDIPIDPSLGRSSSVISDTQPESRVSATPEPTELIKVKSGRKMKELIAPLPLTDADFMGEEELEGEIQNILLERECISSKEQAEKDKIEERAKALAEQQRAAIVQHNALRLEAMGRTHTLVSDSEIIGEDEFADDPEVANALLNEEQVKVKEMIWVAHNEDWLRAQQAKQLKKALEEAEGKDKKVNKRKKRGRMGDGTVLTDAGTPVESPADASLRMLEKRAPKGFSQRVNYAALGKIYGDRRHGESRAGSEASTPAPGSTQAATPSTASQSPEPAPVQAALPTPAATQVSPDPGPETSNETLQPASAGAEEAGAEDDGDDDGEDEGDYWPDEEAQPTSPHYEEEEEFEAATEDVTGDFGIGDDDFGGDDGDAW